MIGSTISHYKIIEKLGEGGMGVVYKAEDTKLKRTVALKFLPARLSTSQQEQTRFLQEAQAASALNHPNVATVYEIDEASGQMFIAMEYIDGQTLREKINDRGAQKGEFFPLQQAIEITIQIAEGLSAAHKKGIVHRDIKPENIILTREGVAKIADFGLAQHALSLHSDEGGSTAGTIAYMSPEQLQGNPVTHLTDIWSLGVVLYELVAGRRPFVGEYEQAIMYGIANEKHSAVSASRPDIPSSVENIIDRCLEKIPTLRFDKASEIVKELKDAGNVQISVRDASVRSIAVLPFADLSPDKDNKYFSDGLTEEIITNLSKLRNLKVISRTSMMRYERLEKTTKEIASELGVKYLLDGSVRKQGSALRITTQLIDAEQDASLWAEKFSGTMEEVFDIQEKVATRIVKALKLRLTPDEKKHLKKRATKNTEAYQLYLKGRFFWNKRSKEGMLAAIRFFEQAIEKDAKYALAWAGLADAHSLLIEFADYVREESYPKAKLAAENALKYDDQLAEAHTSIASLKMLFEWDWTTAEKEFKHAIRLNPNYATAHHWYGEWLLFMGESEKALSEVTIASEIDPLSPAILKDRGMALYYTRHYDEAIESGKKTLELDPKFASAHRLLSLAYQGKRMFAEALEENVRWGEAGWDKAEVMVAAAQLHAAAGNEQESRRLLQTVLQGQSLSGNLHRGIALVYASLGEKELALDWLEKTYHRQAESISSIKVDPKFDVLRSEPRLIELMKKVGIADEHGK